ncbi:MAG: metallophosphoesterase [Thermoplasmata archaeon]|jgi:protein phosphatase
MKDQLYLVNRDYIKDLILALRDYFISLPNVIRLNSEKIAIVGDTHGAINVTDEGLKYLHEGYHVIFLGDLVDRGKNSLRNLLYALESLYLNSNLIIIRGNHESSATTMYYGFLDELKESGIEDLYDYFLVLFSSIPMAVLINNEILCLHGGIPRGDVSLDDIEKLPRDDLFPENKIAFEILWNDPREYIEGFLPSTRGDGAFYFGRDVLEDFLKRNKLKKIIRGHEVKMEGIGFNFNEKVITVFSSEYHKGKKGILFIENGKIRTLIL